MFKRAFWFGSGVVVGAGGTVWATVRLRQAAAQVTPGGLADQALTRARTTGRDVLDAVAEGRLVMRETEARLRDELTPAAIERAGADGLPRTIDVAGVDAERAVAAELVAPRSVRNPGRRSVARR